MRALGVSNRALASACGKSESTIRRWMNGVDEPRGGDVVKIADRLGEDPLNAFIQLGWLPGTANEALKLRMIDQRLRQAILRQVQVDSEPRTPLGAFVDKVSEQPGWAAITSHVGRGAEFRVQFEDHVELVPTSKEVHPPHRDAVNEFLDPLMSVHDASWCDDAPPTLGNWPDGVIKVPRVLAAHPPGENLMPLTPPSIVVIGSHLTGNAKVGSLMATALDYGFVQLATATRLAYGVRANSPDRRADRLEVGRTLFNDPEGVGRQIVWTMNTADGAELVATAIAAGDTTIRPFVIYCRPTDPLIDATVRLRSGPRSASRREMLEARDHMDRVLARTRANTLVIDAQQAIGRGSFQDQYWDEHVRLFGRIVDRVGADWALEETGALVTRVIDLWQ